MTSHESVYTSAVIGAKARRALVALGAVLALLLGTIGLAGPAAAVDDGILSGTVTAGGAPASGYVTAYDEDTDEFGYSFLESDGSYSISLPPGSYEVCVESDDPDYSDQCLEEPAEVTSGATTDLDIVLVENGHVTGTITGAGNVTLKNARATAYVFDDEDDFWYRTASDRTNAAGFYDIPVPEGTYRIRFQGPNDAGYRREFYENSTNVDSATNVSVDSGDSVVRNAQLSRTAGISGHVTGHEGDFSLTVQIINATTGEVRRTTYLDEEGGDYAFWNMKPGTYKVAFNRTSGYAYSAAQFYEGVPEHAGLGAADVIDLGVDEAFQGADADLAVGGSIQGILRDTEGNPLPYCTVEAYTADDSLVRRAGFTSDDGSFEIGGLTTGTYLLRVRGERFNNCDGGTQFYTGSDGHLSLDEDDATGIAVTLGAIKTLANPLEYTRGGRITGTITRPAGSAQGDRMVVVRNTATHRVVAMERAAIDGTYSVDGLKGGTYRVTFNRLSGHAFAAAEFYNDKAEHLGPETANLVDVDLGEIVGGVNATLVDGGSINGRLVDGAGAPLEDCLVQAFTADGSLVTRAAVTAADGSFTVGGLTTGAYHLRVPKQRRSVCDGEGQFYAGSDGVLTNVPDDAEPINVTQGSPVNLANDLVYAYGARISGHVDIPVDSYNNDRRLRIVNNANHRVVGSARVDDDGNYTVGGLPAGSFRVVFDRVSGYAFAAPEWYDNVAESEGAEAADAVVLDPGEEVTGIDAVLAEGGHITGTLVDGDGNGLSCFMQAFTTDGTLVTRNGYSEDDGDFDITGLSTGDYLVRVYPYGDCEEGRQYVANNGGPLAIALDGAETVSVELGETTALSPDLVYDEAPSVDNTVQPSITGAAQVGSTLTANPGSWTPAGVTFAYQWRAAGSPIAGAVGATYVPVVADVGKKISVRVIGSLAGHFSDTAFSPDTAAVAPAGANVIVNTGLPTITGTPKVGSTLTSSTGSWTNSPGLTFTRTWKVAGTPAPGGTSTTFVVPASAVGKPITVTVTASKAGFTPGTATSAATTAVKAAAFTLSKAPKIKGTAKVGKKLKIKPGKLSPAGAKVSYQWLRNGKAISGAKSSSYKLKSKDEDKKISVKVTYTKAGYTTLAKVTKPTAKVKA